MAHVARPVVLCILDGWGLRDERAHNAVAQSHTPCFDRLWHGGDYPTTQLAASGTSVGLPTGQIGNSEVGHLNLGAGRVVKQTLPRIDQALAEDGGEALARGATFGAFADQARAGTGRVHLLGLASSGGVHAHSRHLVALYKLLKARGFAVVLHLWTDGRDVAPHAARDEWPAMLEQIDPADVATITGRYFAMDRDNRWDRVARAYDVIVEGEDAPDARRFDGDPLAVVAQAAAEGTGDEFIPPHVRAGYGGFADGDALVCANFRSDRVREILTSLLDPQFDRFTRQRPIGCASALAMTAYSERLEALMGVLFPPTDLPMGLGEALEAAGKTQFRLAETEKYPHVTFFFSGGREAPYDGEDRHMAPSPKVATYDLAPEMSAAEVGETLAQTIARAKHDVIVCNFANPDMVGHTGDLQAAMAACAAVDAQLARAVEGIERGDGVMLVTADHGNAEQMWDASTGGPHTAHTTNPVPLILVSADKTLDLDTARADAALCDIAPTILALLGVAQPEQMTGRSLLA